MSSFDAGLQKRSGTVDYMENQPRRSNLRIHGIPETLNETWQQTENLVRNQLTKALGLTAETASKIEIEQAHRIHTSMSNPDGKRKTRTVVVRFAKYKDRECVLRQAREKKLRGIFFNEDFSAKVMEKRKALLPCMKEARSEGKIAYTSFDKLVIRDALVVK